MWKFSDKVFFDREECVVLVDGKAYDVYLFAWFGTLLVGGLLLYAVWAITKLLSKVF